MASIRAPQHTTLRWQLTATHLAVTGLVLLLLQALSAGLVVALLVASGRPLNVSLAAVGPGLPGMLLLSTLLFLVGGSVTALLYGQIASRPLARRIERLAAASTALAQGDLSQRVDDPAADELGQLAREFNAMAARLATHVATLEALAEEQTRLAVVEERQRVAHDLHDGVTQSLFSLTLLAATARATLLDDRAVAASALDALDQELEQVLRETRSVIFALQPVALSQLPLGEALRALARTAPQRLGIHIDLSISGEGTLPPAVEHELLLIAREAVTNAARHSGAACARVALHITDAEATLRVHDTGRGFAPEVATPSDTLGLRGMVQRAVRCGGRVNVTSSPGAGTNVVTWVPLAEERRER